MLAEKKKLKLNKNKIEIKRQKYVIENTFELLNQVLIIYLQINLLIINLLHHLK